MDGAPARGYVATVTTSRAALLVALLALAGCRAGAREGLPPAPPYGALVNRPEPKPAPAPAPAGAPILGRVEYFQISDG